MLSSEWGLIKLQRGASISTAKDARVRFDGFKASLSEWDWKLSDMHHQPGITLAEVQAASQGLGKGDLLVLSRGMHNMLGLEPEARAWLCKQDFQWAWETTPDAVALFNARAEPGTRVSALIHSTC